MESQNNLKKIRIVEGLTITELAALSKVSAKVISQTERMLREPKAVTKAKILKALNSAYPGQGKYVFKDIFPEGPDAQYFE